MDWTLAIDRNRDALLRILAALFVMAGGGETLPRHVRGTINRILRPAEAAFRRLLVVLAEQIPASARAAEIWAIPAGALKLLRGTGERIPAFALFDPRKCFEKRTRRYAAGAGPLIWSPGWDYPVFTPKTDPTPDDLVSGARLCRRMKALQAALADLPKQARRLARWQAKRAAERAVSGKYIRPMRPGKPPGHRARQRHPVDFVLSDCHALALYALHRPDEVKVAL